MFSATLVTQTPVAMKRCINCGKLYCMPLEEGNVLSIAENFIAIRSTYFYLCTKYASLNFSIRIINFEPQLNAPTYCEKRILSGFSFD